MIRWSSPSSSPVSPSSRSALWWKRAPIPRRPRATATCAWPRESSPMAMRYSVPRWSGGVSGKPRSGAAAAARRQRFLERAVAHAALRPPVLPYRGLDRPFCRLPPRIACQAWRTPAAGPGAARGRRTAAALRRARRSGDRRRLCAAGRTPAGLPERRGAGGAVAGGADRRTVASGRPARAPAQPRIPGGGGATAGALRQLVRAVPRSKAATRHATVPSTT